MACTCKPVGAQWNGDTLSGGKMIIKNHDIFRTSFAFTDGAGGIVQVFQKVVGNIYPLTYAIRVQRIDSTGTLLWGNIDSGRIVYEATNYYEYPELVDAKPDHSGGAYILYHCPNSVDNPDSFFMCVQHIDHNGLPRWAAPGIRIASMYEYNPLEGKIIVLNNGNIAVVWEQMYSSTNYGELYAQKISESGTLLWAEGGVSLCNAGGARGEYLATHDGAGGIISVFEDARNGIYNNNTQEFDKVELYAQHVNTAGINLFGDSGLLATGNIGDSMSLLSENEITNLILPDTAGGCYFVYGKYSGNNGGLVYIQRLGGNGQRLWGTYGSFVATSNPSEYLFDYRLYQNPAGGVASVYSTDGGTQMYNQFHLYLQFHNSAGTPLYSVPKKAALCADGYSDGAFCFDASFDNSGNTVLIFLGRGEVHTPRIQKIYANGTLQWDTAGKVIVNQNADRVQAISGNNGYTLMHWFDNRNHGSDMYLRDAFTTRVDQNGNLPVARRTITSVANGNWNNPGTWQGGIVPGPDDMVIVGNTVLVTANATCYSLFINQPGGALTVLSGVSFQVLH